MEIPQEIGSLETRIELDKKIVPELERTIDAMNLNESESKHVKAMLKKFFDDNMLFYLGPPYLRAYKSRYRGDGQLEKKRTIACPNCKGENTSELFRFVVEVFKTPILKGRPGYERMQRAPRITRKWNELDSRGNNKEVYAEYQSIVYTHECGDCVALFSYPSIEVATRDYYYGKGKGSILDRMKKELDAEEY